MQRVCLMKKIIFLITTLFYCSFAYADQGSPVQTFKRGNFVPYEQCIEARKEGTTIHQKKFSGGGSGLYILHDGYLFYLAFVEGSNEHSVSCVIHDPQ